MKELHLWSNKKRFWFYYMLSYAFILGLVLIGMGYETIKAESLFFLAFPTLLLGYWIHYWVNDGLTRSLPSKFETMGYRDYFGIPCTLIHEKERKIVIINLVGKMKVNLSVQQYNFSDLMSIKKLLIVAWPISQAIPVLLADEFVRHLHGPDETWLSVRQDQLRPTALTRLLVVHLQHNCISLLPDSARKVCHTALTLKQVFAEPWLPMQ